MSSACAWTGSASPGWSTSSRRRPEFPATPRRGDRGRGRRSASKASGGRAPPAAGPVMDTNDLFEWYPRLYHMTEDGAWSSIRRRGLLSTASLIDLFEIPEPKRTRLLEERRPESVELTHPVHGRVVLRDQKPLWPSKLQNLLTDMTVPQWIRLLNGHVFFWLHPDRLTGLLNA